MPMATAPRPAAASPAAPASAAATVTARAAAAVRAGEGEGDDDQQRQEPPGPSTSTAAAGATYSERFEHFKLQVTRNLLRDSSDKKTFLARLGGSSSRADGAETGASESTAAAAAARGEQGERRRAMPGVARATTSSAAVLDSTTAGGGAPHKPRLVSAVSHPSSTGGGEHMKTGARGRGGRGGVQATRAARRERAHRLSDALKPHSAPVHIIASVFEWPALASQVREIRSAARDSHGAVCTFPLKVARASSFSNNDAGRGADGTETEEEEEEDVCEAYKPELTLDDGARVTVHAFNATVTRVRDAIHAGLPPRLNAKGSSGSYFARDAKATTVAIFKPKDEEPYGNLNPKTIKWIHRNFLSRIIPFGRACLIPGLSYLSEAAASLIDRRLALGLVPRTHVVSLSSDAFYYDWMDRERHARQAKPLRPKDGSFQLFLRGFKDASIFLRDHPFPGRALAQTLDTSPRRAGHARRKRATLARALRFLCGRAGAELTRSDSPSSLSREEDFSDEEEDDQAQPPRRAPRKLWAALAKRADERGERAPLLGARGASGKGGADDEHKQRRASSSASTPSPRDAPDARETGQRQPAPPPTTEAPTPTTAPGAFEWTDEMCESFRLALEKLVVLDYLIRNTDRGLDNFMLRPCTAGDKGPHMHVAAIDNSLAFPHMHPRGWRTYTYGWLHLPLSLIGQPFSDQTRAHFLPRLANPAWWAQTTADLRDLFSRDPDFKESMFHKQIALLKGQAFNIVETLKTPGEGPLELCRRSKKMVWNEYVEVADDQLTTALVAAAAGIDDRRDEAAISARVPPPVTSRAPPPQSSIPMSIDGTLAGDTAHFAVACSAPGGTYMPRMHMRSESDTAMPLSNDGSAPPSPPPPAPPALPPPTVTTQPIPVPQMGAKNRRPAASPPQQQQQQQGSSSLLANLALDSRSYGSITGAHVLDHFHEVEKERRRVGITKPTRHRRRLSTRATPRHEVLSVGSIEEEDYNLLNDDDDNADEERAAEDSDDEDEGPSREDLLSRSVLSDGGPRRPPNARAALSMGQAPSSTPRRPPRGPERLSSSFIFGARRARGLSVDGEVEEQQARKTRIVVVEHLEELEDQPSALKQLLCCA